MGKFDGILLCSDLDETLLDDGRNISYENKKALEYFMSEGGRFTFATGRVPQGAKLNLKYIVPNTPMICFNGSAIYDFETDRIIWERFVDAYAGEVVEYVRSKMPKTGIEICANENNYYITTNRLTKQHLQIEGIKEVLAELSDIKEPWKKVIFMVEEEDMIPLRKLIADSPYKDRYTFIQSWIHYFELLPKGAGKGEAMLELAKMYGIDPRHTIGVGDNENDLSLIRLAGVGIAVENARYEVKESADYITVDNNSHALSRIIQDIEDGKITF